MQLYEELPSLVAMFLCGFFGFMAVEWLKRCATASARHRQKLEGLCQTTNPSVGNPILARNASEKGKLLARLARRCIQLPLMANNLLHMALL